MDRSDKGSGWGADHRLSAVKSVMGGYTAASRNTAGWHSALGISARARHGDPICASGFASAAEPASESPFGPYTGPANIAIPTPIAPATPEPSRETKGGKKRGGIAAGIFAVLAAGVAAAVWYGGLVNIGDLTGGGGTSGGGTTTGGETGGGTTTGGETGGGTTTGGETGGGTTTGGETGGGTTTGGETGGGTTTGGETGGGTTTGGETGGGTTTGGETGGGATTGGETGGGTTTGGETGGGPRRVAKPAAAPRRAVRLVGAPRRAVKPAAAPRRVAKPAAALATGGETGGGTTTGGETGGGTTTGGETGGGTTTGGETGGGTTTGGGQTTGGQIDAVAEQISWMRNYSGGNCFYAAPTSINDTKAEIEGFGDSVDAFKCAADRLSGEVQHRAGYSGSPDPSEAVPDHRFRRSSGRRHHQSAESFAGEV